MHTLARLACLLRGHRPERVATQGRTDRIEIIDETRVSVPVQVVAELDYCTRCGARRLALDPTLSTRVDRSLVRWVAA